jgi:hypothetical protein
MPNLLPNLQLDVEAIVNKRKRLTCSIMALLAVLCYGQGTESVKSNRANQVSLGGGLWMAICPVIDIGWFPLDQLELEGALSIGPFISPSGDAAGGEIPIDAPLMAHLSVAYMPLNSVLTPFVSLVCHMGLSDFKSLEYSVGLGLDGELDNKVYLRIMWEPTYLYYQSTENMYVLGPIGPYLGAQVGIRF